jgi:hypothetical protein
MSKKKICSLSIRYRIECDGLIGDKYEYNPYLAYCTSFGAYRLMQRDPLVRLTSPQGLSKRKPTNAKEGGNSGGDGSIFMSKDYPVYKESAPLEIVLLDYDEMKGDDAILFKLFSHTRYSGVESIDKSEEAYVERQIASGLCQLELFELFQFYLKNEANNEVVTVRDRFYDQKILEEKVRDLIKLRKNPNSPTNTEELEQLFEQAKPLTQKATILFEVTIKQFNHALFKKSIFNVPNLKEQHLHSMLPLNKNNSNNLSASPLVAKTQTSPSFEPILYNSEKSWKFMSSTMTELLSLYCRHFMQDEDNGGEASLYMPCEEVVSNLQFPLYKADKGDLPVSGYWANHDPYYREYASAEAREEDMRLYGFNQKTEDYFLLLLRSSLRRHGLQESSFIHAIKSHFSPLSTSIKLSEHFMVAEEVIADVGTFAANSAYYTADYRFMMEATSFQGHKHKELSEARQCTQCGKQFKMKVLSLDSWDNYILNNTAMCDDCEGQDNTATSIIRSFAIGRYDMGFKWKHEALQLTQKFLQYSAVIDVAALVTSAFVDNNNKKIESRQEELPLIGSDLDKNAQNDGHCFGLMQSQTRCIKQLANANAKPELLEAMRVANRVGGTQEQEALFQLRDGQRRVLVLEPTGSIEPRLLSVEESYGREVCHNTDAILQSKKTAEFYFMKHMRSKLKKQEEEWSEISDLFMGEGLTHYVEKQVPERRVSAFYNTIVHGSSVDLMKRYDVSLSQFAFCKRVNREDRYGVRIGELIRDTPNSRLSLVCPYREYNEKWHSEVVPMMATIQNQMPIMKFGRYSDKEYAEEIYSRFISPKEISASFDFKGFPMKNNNNNKERLAFERLLAGVDAPGSNMSVVRLSTRTWKLTQDKEKTERLKKFIREMPGLISHAYYLEKHMPICEPVVEILCIIDVKKSLTLSIK